MLITVPASSFGALNLIKIPVKGARSSDMVTMKTFLSCIEIHKKLAKTQFKTLTSVADLYQQCIYARGTLCRGGWGGSGVGRELKAG